MKRVFGTVEAVFDGLYLVSALTIGIILLLRASNHGVRALAGIMALVLAGGDAFHLIPRIKLILTGREEQLRPILGRGKQITSITMTLFYVLLWHVGVSLFAPAAIIFWSTLVYGLAAIRIFLCMLPQNRWKDRFPPVDWTIGRNIPFFLLGLVVGGLFFRFRALNPAAGRMWIPIFLSFAFYLPVVLWANKNPKIGMLMLPKTMCYLWMLVICLAL
ncbi:MAG TPA: hypothetical protein DCR44_06125 [Acholeplasmatales bacterium]|nr:hypothetical protein [Acholeplasmatales bacterium]